MEAEVVAAAGMEAAAVEVAEVSAVGVPGVGVMEVQRPHCPPMVGRNGMVVADTAAVVVEDSAVAVDLVAVDSVVAVVLVHPPAIATLARPPLAVVVVVVEIPMAAPARP